MGLNLKICTIFNCWILFLKSWKSSMLSNKKIECSTLLKSVHWYICLFFWPLNVLNLYGRLMLITLLTTYTHEICSTIRTFTSIHMIISWIIDFENLINWKWTNEQVPFVLFFTTLQFLWQQLNVFIDNLNFLVSFLEIPFPVSDISCTL